MNPRTVYKNKCCVNGCSDVTSKRHRFPLNDEETFKKWIELIPHPQFQLITPQQIYKTYYVCHKHFAEDALVPGTKRGLKRGAVPSLYLQDNTVDGEVEPKKLKLSAASDELETEFGGENVKHIETDDYNNFRNIPGSSKTPKVIEHEGTVTLTPNRGSHDEPSLKLPHKAYSKRSILKEVDVTRANQLTPKARELHKMVRNYGTELTKFNKRVVGFKERLANAENVGNHFANLPQYVKLKKLKVITCLKT